jgi:hypothetical protein
MMPPALNLLAAAGFVSVFVALWGRPKEINKEGHLWAYLRGFRLATPGFLVAYAVMMCNLVIFDHVSDFPARMLVGIVLTLVFVGPIPYAFTRKITLRGDTLHGFSIFTGTKTVKLDEIKSIRPSYWWGGLVIDAGSQRVVFDPILSGSEALLEAILANRAASTLQRAIGSHHPNGRR